jgi:predicted PurR-regulated permease PerM
MSNKITINPKTIIFSVLLLLGILLAYELRSVLITIFVAYVLNAGLRPIVSFFESKKLPRGLAIALTYLIIIVVFGFILFVIFNTAVDQIRLFVNNLDENYLENFLNNFPFLSQIIQLDQLDLSINSLRNMVSTDFYNVLLQGLNVVGGRGISLIANIFGSLLNLIVILIMSVYMIQNRKHIYEPLLKLFPDKYSKKLNPILHKIETSMGNWLLGQIVLMVVIGFATYLTLMVPSVLDAGYPMARYALVLAILAGVLEGIPNIGPFITLIITLLVAVVTGASLPIIIYIVIAFTVLQQLEAVFIVPVVMKRAVDLHPVVTIAGVLAGFSLGGPIGALLSIPLIGIIQIIVLNVLEEWKTSVDS